MYLDLLFEKCFPSFLVLLIAVVIFIAIWPHLKHLRLFPQTSIPTSKEDEDRRKKGIIMRVAMRDRD